MFPPNFKPCSRSVILGDFSHQQSYLNPANPNPNGTAMSSAAGQELSFSMLSSARNPSSCSSPDAEAKIPLVWEKAGVPEPPPAPRFQHVEILQILSIPIALGRVIRNPNQRGFLGGGVTRRGTSNGDGKCKTKPSDILQSPQKAPAVLGGRWPARRAPSTARARLLKLRF